MTIDNIIGFITDVGYDLLKIYENPNEVGETLRYSWWVINEWSPANGNIESNDDFSVVVGFEITDFININHVDQNRESFIGKFEVYIDKKDIQWRCKFHKAIKWKLYSKLD